ncbi:hypothetical protein G9F73_002980 [Clostridium estertheticum]|uniref:hypothetical protein n=1 Tax=Clostridium estertheticum TaxID=238834 RepID=UPI0013EE9793|nr:hypothetical protein [Clostridium estertheticum]MBZ9606797.1 hypothetical protein [Clostridium estertheticum]
MKVYEFGNIENPKLLMFHGMACTWKQNFGQVIEKLKEQFYLIIPAYNGHNPDENKDFTSITQTASEIDDYIMKNHNGKIYASYGLSMGANILVEVLSNQRIQMEKAIIDAPDFVPFPSWFVKPVSKMVASVGVKVLQNPKKLNSIILFLMTGSTSKDYGEEMINSSVFSGLTKNTIYNAYYADHVQHIPKAFKDTNVQVICWCGSTENWAIKSIKNLKKYIPQLREKQFEGYKHGELIIIHSELFIAELETVLLTDLVGKIS